MNDAQTIRGYVEQFGLHSSMTIGGRRCCTMDELDAAIEHELKQRREHNSTSMIVTTGSGGSAAGVYLPAPQD